MKAKTVYEYLTVLVSLQKCFIKFYQSPKKVWFYIIQDWKNQGFVEKMRTNFDPGYNLKLPFPIT